MCCVMFCGIAQRCFLRSHHPHRARPLRGAARSTGSAPATTPNGWDVLAPPSQPRAFGAGQDGLGVCRHLRGFRCASDCLTERRRRGPCQSELAHRLLPVPVAGGVAALAARSVSRHAHCALTPNLASGWTVVRGSGSGQCACGRDRTRVGTLATSSLLRVACTLVHRRCRSAALSAAPHGPDPPRRHCPAIDGTGARHAQQTVRAACIRNDYGSRRRCNVRT